MTPDNNQPKPPISNALSGKTQSTSPISSPPNPNQTPESLIANDRVERFLKTFETSARRWELVVYPSLFAFIVLAGYGFFLVYSLARDIHRLVDTIDKQMVVSVDSMADNMVTMSGNVEKMTQKVSDMSMSMTYMSSDVRAMSTEMDDISLKMARMSENMETLTPIMASMVTMNTTMMRMSDDMQHMNHSIARPMSFFNTFAPW